MKDEIKEAIDLIEKLNDKMYIEDSLWYVPFEFGFAGWQQSYIKFLGVTIWTTEDSDRKWIEEEDRYEPLEGFLIRESKNIIENMNKGMSQL